MNCCSNGNCSCKVKCKICACAARKKAEEAAKKPTDNGCGKNGTLVEKKKP